jgi:hypothetical protein
VIARPEAGRLAGVVFAGQQALREWLVDQHACTVAGREGEDVVVAGRRGRGQRVEPDGQVVGTDAVEEAAEPGVFVFPLPARLSRFWVVVRLCGCKGLVKMSPRPHLLVIPNVICGVEFSGLTGFLAFRVVSRVPAARGLTAGDARVGFRGCRQGTCPSSRLAVARLQVRFHVGIWGR